MPVTYTIETYDEFSARHGLEHVRVGSTLLWRDGASAMAENVEMRHEPPTERDDLLRYREAFLLEWLKQTEEGFARCKADAQRGPSVELIEELKRLKALADTTRAELQAVQDEQKERYENSPAGQRAKRTAEYEAQKAQRDAEMLSIINSIEL